jgi:hypothetical protein
MATKSIKIGDREFKVEDVTTKKEELHDKILNIEKTLNEVKQSSSNIHETCKTNNSIDTTLESTIESLKREQKSSNTLLEEWIKYGESYALKADEFERKSTEAEARADSCEKKKKSSNTVLEQLYESHALKADVFERKLTEAEARADACEKEKKSTTTNSFNLVFKASEKTMTDAKNAIKEKKKLIIDESPLDDNINEIYPSIESKDDEIVHTLENTIDNLKILTEVNRIRILKKIYPKIQEYLKNWRSTFADAEECEKKSKAAAEANVASTAKVEETKKGGNRRSKEYIKYKKEYLTLKKHLKNK